MILNEKILSKVLRSLKLMSAWVVRALWSEGILFFNIV